MHVIHAVQVQVSHIIYLFDFVYQIEFVTLRYFGNINLWHLTSVIRKWKEVLLKKRFW